MVVHVAVLLVFIKTLILYVLHATVQYHTAIFAIVARIALAVPHQVLTILTAVAIAVVLLRHT